MNRIYLIDYQRIDFLGEFKYTENHKSLKRYTNLQKSATEALNKIKLEQESIYHHIKNPKDTLIIFTSQFGELSLNISIAESVINKDLPIFPVKFQRSVFNSTFGQSSIDHGLNNTHLSIGKGFLSLDHAIYLGYTLLKNNIWKNIFIIYGDEISMKPENGKLSRCETLLLSNQKYKSQNSTELINIAYKDSSTYITQKEEHMDLYFETQESLSYIFCTFNPIPSCDFTRYSLSSEKDGYFSNWRNIK